jgi:uncharacterized protein (TIGR03435 family)
VGPVTSISSIMKPALLLLTAITCGGQTFDVATIKPTSPSERGIGMFTYPGGRITATNYTLKGFLHEAYSIDDRRIEGGPKWADEKPFSLVAVPPAGSASSRINPSNIKLPPPEEELRMLRALLAERFHLKVHEETREGSVYSLSVERVNQLNPAKNKEAFPGLFMGQTGKERVYYLSAENASLPLVSTRLESFVGRPVVPQTDLAGTFDFRFEYEIVDGLSNFINAIQQVGLKLTPTRGPIRYLVIDEAQEPDENYSPLLPGLTVSTQSGRGV